jgi:hypothetical protein
MEGVIFLGFKFYVLVGERKLNAMQTRIEA